RQLQERSGSSHSVIALKRIRQVPNKNADLRQHGLCLSIDRLGRWRPGSFPVGKYAHKLGRPELVLNVPANHSDDAASSNARFTSPSIPWIISFGENLTFCRACDLANCHSSWMSRSNVTWAMQAC